MIVQRAVLYTDNGHTIAAQTDPEDTVCPVGIGVATDANANLDDDEYYSWPSRTDLRAWCQWVLAQIDNTDDTVTQEAT